MDRNDSPVVARAEAAGNAGAPRVSHRIAEFEDSDDAHRFAKMKGPDYTVCGGIRFMYAVRPKARHEVAGNGVEPNDSFVEEDDFYEEDQ